MSPYAILAVALFWLGSCAGSVWLGYDYRDGKVAQQILEATNDALSTARVQAFADMEAAAERAAAAAIASERSRKAKTAGVADAISSSRSDCVRGAESMRLLNVAIESANGTPDTSGRLSLKMSSTTQASGREGFDSTSMGVRSY